MEADSEAASEEELSVEEVELVEEVEVLEVSEVPPQEAKETAAIAAQIEARISFFIGDFPFFAGAFCTLMFLSFLSFDKAIIKFARKL